MGGLLEARDKMLGIFTLHGVPEWNAEREIWLLKGKSLSCRDFPLVKQSTGLFHNSPFSERTL